MDFPNGPAHRVQGRVCEQIAHRPRPDRLDNMRFVVVGRKNEHGSDRRELKNVAKGFQPVGDARGDVQKNHLGSKFLRHPKSLAAILGFSDKLKVDGAFQRLPDFAPHNVAVPGQQDRDLPLANTRWIRFCAQVTCP